MSTPAFFVAVAGVDVSANFSSILLELVVECNENMESDSVHITLADRNGSVAIPPIGDPIAVGMGYLESGIKPMGLFTVEEVCCRGWPREIRIRGRSFDLCGKWKEPRSTKYENKTVPAIVSEVAGRNGATSSTSSSIAQQKYDYLAQTAQSDSDFVNRLAHDHDATARLKDGVLRFHKKGEMLTGVVTAICPGNLKSYEWRHMGRPGHKGTRGHWWDRKESKYKRTKSK